MSLVIDRTIKYTVVVEDEERRTIKFLNEGLTLGGCFFWLQGTARASIGLISKPRHPVSRLSTQTNRTSGIISYI